MNSTEDYNSDLNDMSISNSINETIQRVITTKDMLELCLALFLTYLWIIYITFYHSRIVGYIITKFVNRLFIKSAYFKIGSLTINPLAGKIMFRDVVYINYDYTYRVQDGYVIFRWWRNYVPKDVSDTRTDLSHSDTRLSIMLNGSELHIYNRSELYSEVEKAFGLKPSILIPVETLSAEELAKIQEQALNLENQKISKTDKLKKKRPEAMNARTWRDLIPVIKLDISSGRFSFGNRLTPTTLSICLEEAHCVYSTKPAVNPLDHFMHFVKAKVENAKVLLAPSPKYHGLNDEPPRYMGEGFVVMMSNFLELYFYMDEAGIVPEEPVLVTLPNGDIVEAAPPIWGIDIKCGKGSSNISYGPWADRQREHLYKFFFPQTFEDLEATPTPKPGERRIVHTFDVKWSTLTNATIDILFSKDKETNAVHINIGAGSYMEAVLPWITLQDGFSTKITGQFLHVDATTSLQYRSLAEFESLHYNVKIHYPTRWNDHQDWGINLIGYKATANIVFEHKEFFQYLIEDWASKSHPDIYSFVPYTCKFSILLKEFEIITLSNEFNWIDCSSTNQENNHLAFCGDLFDLSFALPFDDFLPNIIPLKFWIHGEGLDLSLYLPEISTSRPIIHAMDENARILTRDGQVKKKSELYTKKWRRVCLTSAGWIDCWNVPILALSIQYIYHPMPPLGPDPQAGITTPEKEELLLTPMRIPKFKKTQNFSWSACNGQRTFNPTSLESDQVTVEIEIGSSVLLAYGSILKNFYYLKENIFGEDQKFTDMGTSNAKSPSHKISAAAMKNNKDDINKSVSEAPSSVDIDDKPKRFDPRLYRPLDVTVILTIHDIQAHLMKNCNENDPPCPVVLIERLGFEMRKRYYETELQVLVSPSFLITSDNFPRPSKEKHLKQGHLLLSALQIRGHAMFSNESRTLDEETLEYAWLLEIQLGKISGKLTLPQLTHVLTGLESMMYLALDPENDLKSPKTIVYCHHGIASNLCPQTKEEMKYRCPSSEDIKYRMVRVAVDAVDLYLVDNSCALHSWISPVRFSTCNLHGQQVKSGITALIPNILVRHFVSTSGHFSQTSGNSQSNTNTTGSGRSTKLQTQVSKREDQKEDLNLLVKRGDEASTNAIRAKKENEYGLYRKGSREKDDSYGSMRRSREENVFKRDELYSSSHSHKNRDSESFHEPWLEVGCLALGPIIIEAATALPQPEHCLHLVQNSYLKLHDEKSKRLMFLWATTDVKCGCLGGCVFFGLNRNGPKFFKPSAQDLQDGINIARYHIISNGKEYGFGQSLIHDGQLVFHTPPYSLQPVSLQECYEYINKTTSRTSRHTIDTKSPLPQKHDSMHNSQHKNDISPNNTFVRDKSGRSTLERVKEKETNSPVTGERRGRRFSYTNSKQTHDVPYRLLDSSPKTQQKAMENRQQSRQEFDQRRSSQKDDDIEMLSKSAPQQSHPLQSDSEQSLSPKFCDDLTLRDVQRTISLTSENPSEAFFSADEDMHASRSSSLKATDGTLPLAGPKKRFASDLSIVGPGDLNGKLSSHRSDYEIHTPEHRKLPTRPQSTAELTNPDSSESQSLSSSSFISALSSQEDMTLVNLHMQANRPIVESPLLMASYLTHLAQVRCTNWSHCSLPLGSDAFSMPLFQKNDDGGLVYIGSKLVPHFDNYSHWREIKIISRFDGGASTSNVPPSCSTAQPKSHPWDPMVFVKSSNEKSKTDETKKDQEFLGAFHGDLPSSRASLVVRFKGQIDIMITPLLLESSQRMVESMIPTLSALHPLTVVNYLHSSCVSKVEAINILKRDQSKSYWSKVHSNSKRSTTERNLQAGLPVMTDIYEESISTQFQGLVMFPKINISMIQSSVVEEVISFAALDNVQELSCASLLAVSLENVSMKFHLGKQTKACMHTVYTQPAIRSGGFKKGGLISNTRALLAHLSNTNRTETGPLEAILIETSENQLEELVITLDVGKTHAQLRRLKNDGYSQESQTVITAIPSHRSRAMFDCTKFPEEAGDNNGLGFIMFECGLEGISVKVVKRSHFEKSENAEENIKSVTEKVKVPVAAETSTNAAMNIVHVFNESGSMKAAEAIATTVKHIAMKKPTTPKPIGSTKERPKEYEKEPEKEPTFVKDEDPEPKLNPTPINAPSELANDNGKISSCVIDLKTVWFNFAAPPRTPITKKIDYSRLDWNLLSTAAPSITAWMNPANRLAIKTVALMRMMYQRRTAIITTLMVETLEEHSNYRPPKSRYPSKFTLMAKTLQDDCSCKLFTILQKYVTAKSVEKIEENLKQQFIPPLSTLRQAVIVLSRQWKSILYNPMLFEHQYKGKLNRPNLNVTYSVPTLEEDDDNDEDNNELNATNTDNNPLLADDENESTLLLKQHPLAQHVINIPEEISNMHITRLTDSIHSTPSTVPSSKKKKPSLRNNPPPSSLSSIQVFPIIAGLVEKQEAHIEYGALKSGSVPSICSSNESVERIKPPRPPPPVISDSSKEPSNVKDDLYAWMAKQQTLESSQFDEQKVEKNENVRPITPSKPTIQTINEYIQDSGRLSDAHLIFEPLLTCLDVMPCYNNDKEKGSSSLEILGTNLSLVLLFDTLRVDIVVSEAGDKKPKAKISKKANGKFALNLGNDTPAFLSERIDIELEVLKMADGLNEQPKHLYVSRGQLKKHISTVVNFSINIRYISQQVNMPLLRLLHQISNMYMNVKEAQDEMKEQPEAKRSLPLKDESSLASEMNDATLIGSIHEPPLDNTIFDYADERYDKFNEMAFPLGHSVSRTKMPPLGPLIPLATSSSASSSNARQRPPQSFAQKLRSTVKLGYTNLSETIPTPNKSSPTASTFEQSIQKMALEPKNSLTGAMPVPVGGALINEAFADINYDAMPNSELPKCWTTIYNLLEIYAAMPEMKTISQRVSLSPDAIANLKSKMRQNFFENNRNDDDKTNINEAQQQVQFYEKTRLVVFGVVKIHRTRLLATLSGLKLEAELTSFNSSTTWRKKTKPASLECSLTGQIGRAMIVLLEGTAPNQQTVVKITVGKSQTLYSSITKRGKDKNNGLLTVGAIFIDIPLHPLQLHTMVTRSSKQLSTTLQELRVTRTSARMSKQAEDLESPMHSKESKEKNTSSKKTKVNQTANNMQSDNKSGLLIPLVMQFNVFFQSLSITASLLPSLQAQYKMDNVSSKGITGSKANFTIDLPTQCLSFITKATTQDTNSNLPPQASIPLPQVYIRAEFIPEENSANTKDTQIDGVILRQGGYLAASAEIGEFERCLTTDLLNHLVFVQKVFMKEINEVVQKIYGGEKPVNPLWLEENEESHSSLKRILFSFNIHVKRIQLTATTPCNSAVRFETGAIDFHLSNRVKNLADGANTKLFGKAQIDLNLSLGQIIKNAIFDEAEPEFQQYAFFNTTIGFRNAFQNEMLNDDRELVMITLKRPLVYFQPVAIDKAILVWLNYKTAYEYWAEKRANLNLEVLTATQQVFEKVPFSASNLSTLFLQLTVEDMGICMPLNIPPLNSTWSARSIVQDYEQKKFIVITLENTIISACSSGSLVSKGKFVGLCLRFADDFDSSLDDWKPNINEGNIMNLCVVTEGIYEVCSTTIASKKLNENAKWFLNVKWQMEGVDINLDINIGKHLSALGHTLTQMQAGAEEEDNPVTLESPDSEDVSFSGKLSQDVLPRAKRTLESLPSFLFDPTLDSKKRSLLMENEISEQTRIVSDLRSLGASVNTISHEERRLEELQALSYKYFRRDMIQKLKRPSALKRSMMLSNNRSRSFVAPSPTHEDIDMENAAMDTIVPIDESSESVHGSPSSNASSLKIIIPSQRVQFSDAMRRQSSLPSADSESFSESGPEWPSMISVREGVQTITIDGENVELRNKKMSQPLAMQKTHEPNIDFELDIKVVVNSGKCVLHTKESSDEKSSTYSNTAKTHRRERSIGTDFGSPLPQRKSKDKSKFKYNSSSGAMIDLTIFHIPGLDVKLHYQSKTIVDEMSPRMSTVDPFGMPMNNRKTSTKRASLFAWITLQSIPEETIISPHILEFLEQTLEPIPRAQFSVPSNPVNLEMLEHNYVVYASFPVDVIVYFHMNPSTFRFSCLPVSRVECLLQLPSLNIIFSSKRQEENAMNEMDSKDAQSAAVGGLSVTGCLADFNIYIFHPYGGGSKKANLKESQPFSPLTDSERKDSLSINVEFVKFHLTRSRKLNFESNLPRKAIDQSSSRALIKFNSIVDIGTASFKYDMRRLTEILAFPKAWYRRNIMKRLFLGDLSVQQTNLNDDFPPTAEENPLSRSPNEKSPLFLAKQKMKLNLENEMGKSAKSKCGKFTSPDGATILPSGDHQYSSWETLVLFAINFQKLNVQMNMGNVMGNCLWLSKSFRSDGSLSIGSSGHKNLYIALSLGGSTLESKGGIVGGIVELSKINTHFHICEEPNYEPDHKIGIDFKALELKFDYMGTSVLMMRISDFNAALRDEWKRSNNLCSVPKRPVIILIHGDLNWDQFQIMISKSTTADILKMFYKLEDFFSQQFKSSKRVFTSLEPKLQADNSLRRKQLKKKISASGTPDENVQLDARHHRHWQNPLKRAMGMCISTLKKPLPKTGIVLGGTMELHGKNISLACFHGINFKSKSWALFSLREPCINFATEAQYLEKSGESLVNQTLTFGLGLDTQTIPQHHSMATVVRMSRNVIFPPQFKTLQEWFHYAFANSEIDAVDRFPVLEKDTRESNTNSIERARSSSTVPTNVKLQDHNHNREVIFALPSLQLHFKTEHLQPPIIDLKQEKPTVECSFITEFEDHIFVTVDADAFFFLHDLITSYLKEKEKVLNTQNARANSPNLLPNASSNNLDVASTNIGASTTSMASDSLSVSSNMAIYSSNKNLAPLSGASSVNNINSSEDLRVTVNNKKIGASKNDKEKVDIETFLRMDWRNFNCKTWHLEPTIRLLSWAGQQIEPYGIDFILNKLGFSHARTTIPKWLQRGFMDPLDKFQSILLMQLLLMVEENKQDESEEKNVSQ